MNIFGIGPLEFTLIIFIALIVLGPNDMVKAGRTLGHWLRKIVMSQEWKAVQNASRELRTLPNKLIREAGIEEARQAMNDQMADVRKISNDIQSDFQHIQTDLSYQVAPSQNKQTINETQNDALPPPSNSPDTNSPGEI